MSRAGFQPRREPKTSDLLIRQKVEAMIDALFFWDKNHCEQAHLSELLRRHLPRQYRTTK